MSRHRNRDIDVVLLAYDHAFITFRHPTVCENVRRCTSTLRAIMHCNRLRVMDMVIVGDTFGQRYSFDENNTMTVTDIVKPTEVPACSS